MKGVYNVFRNQQVLYLYTHDPGNPVFGPSSQVYCVEGAEVTV